MDDSEILAIKDLIEQIIGDDGRIAYDADARVMTLLATQIPASPIVLEFFEDGCVYIFTGSSSYFPIPDASFDREYLLDIVAAIVDGRCEEAIARSEDGGLQIWTGLTTSGQTRMEIPSDGLLVKWRLADWRGGLTAPEVSRAP
ncbi:MAG: hypothetical protein LBR58_04445 [Propionibacteriaceae bacterium]|nr:hypothetical protein [Propionibacteriaceae bacterium]